MSKTYFELLGLPTTATLDEIRRSFRREIAKYHPDKVQHLGEEFQEIAAVKAAELTQAYKTLSNDELRAEYEELLRSGEAGAAQVRTAGPAGAPVVAADEVPQPTPQESPRPAAEPAASAVPLGSVFEQDRAASSDLVLRAAMMRFRQALSAEFASWEAVQAPGFQIGCIPKPPFWKLKLPPRVLGRFVDTVDGAAVTESWGQASKMKKDNQRDLVVFLMGPVVAPVDELGGAIAQQRKKPMAAGGTLILVPVNTRNWNAHVPNDAPPVVKSLLARLKSS